MVHFDDDIIVGLNYQFNTIIRKQESEYRSRLSGYAKWLYACARLARPVLRIYKWLANALISIRWYGEVVSTKEQISRLHQLVQLIQLGLQGIAPTDYYQYLLYRNEYRTQAKYFLFHQKMDVLVNSLADEVAPAASEKLRDKARFFRHCQENNLSTIPVFAVIDDDKILPENWDGKSALPSCDLFSKPVDWWQGIGAQRWNYIDGNFYKNGKNKKYSQEDLLTTIKIQSQKLNRCILLQPCITNHAELKRLAGQTLCTTRIISGLAPNENRSKAILARFAFPGPDKLVSNFNAGGMVAPVDLVTGVLGPSRIKNPIEVMDKIKQHPVTKQDITGFQLPDWSKALKLSLRAHESFAPVPFVGWDVAFTPNGPILVEGNTGFGADDLQIAHQVPLGKTEFAYIYHRYLQ